MTISVLPRRRRLRFRPRTATQKLRFRAAMARMKLRFVPGTVKPRPAEPSEPTSRLRALGVSFLAAAAIASGPLMLVKQPTRPHAVQAAARIVEEEAPPSSSPEPASAPTAAVAPAPVRRSGRRAPPPESAASRSLAQQFAAAVTGIDGPPPNPYRFRR
ncbi:MAG: hypothetical protein U0230_04115 [Polyangiales bacterium]